MRSDKHDRFVWTILGLVVIGLCAYAASGCRTGDQYRAAFQSTTVTYGTYDGRMNSEKQGERFFNEDGSFLAFGIQPFAWHQMKMQADLQARAFVEAQYAAATRPETQPCEGKPK